MVIFINKLILLINVFKTKLWWIVNFFIFYLVIIPYHARLLIKLVRFLVIHELINLFIYFLNSWVHKFETVGDTRQDSHPIISISIFSNILCRVSSKYFVWRMKIWFCNWDSLLGICILIIKKRKLYFVIYIYGYTI